jgi:hypothetical protein
MTYAAQDSAYRGYPPPPRTGGTTWFWHPGWIIATILGLIFWWPIGLVILGVAIANQKMGCATGWQDRMQDKMDRVRAKMDSFGGNWGGGGSSGNRAFDDYRADTLRRLEEEQREFREFLQRLRAAKDKAEFDQFMADRRNRPEPPPAPQQT